MRDTPQPPPDLVLEQAVDRFWETIPPLWNHLRARIRSVAAENFDLTVEQFHILRHIRTGVHTTSDLADAKNISRPAISQAVDVLVNKGLVARAQSTRDRRCVDLELTGEGNALLDAVFQDTRGWMKANLAALSPGELETVLQALDALKSVFNLPK
jgi:DNA-binding MarR family transcriptional regulator